jgi:hypothetical protein
MSAPSPSRLRCGRGPMRSASSVGEASPTKRPTCWAKFARVALRTANIDYNGRFCMASAAAAGLRAFGIDRGMPFPMEDIAKAQALMLIGGNPAETLPVIMQYLEAHREGGGARRSTLAGPTPPSLPRCISSSLPEPTARWRMGSCTLQFSMGSSRKKGTYKKLIVRNGRLVGGILVGDITKAAYLMQAFDRDAPLPEERLSLLFDFGAPSQRSRSTKCRPALTSLLATIWNDEYEDERDARFL